MALHTVRTVGTDHRGMTHAKTRAASLVALPLTLLLLTGCGMSGTAGDADPADAAPANASASASAAAGDAASTDATFGKTITYDDGLAVTVVDKGTFKPGTYASKEKAKKYRKFQITIKNGTDEKFDPTLVSATLQDGEEEASGVFDTDAKLSGSPQTKVRPGKSVKWLVGFGVDTNDLTMDVALNDLSHDDASFVSK